MIRLFPALSAVLLTIPGLCQVPQAQPATDATPTAAVGGARGTATVDEPPKAKTDQRTQLNLLGQTDAGSGESRRNENVQFNLIDNNALKELKTRLGTTATILTEFEPDRSYFASEYGDVPAGGVHLKSLPRPGAIHGSLSETHSNSVFNARSFFQVGDVKPAHSNDYGLAIGAPLWSGAHVSAAASQQRIRGIVNGNVLVPTFAERTPLATDPRVRALVERYLSAFPRELPNRTDFNERALNTNSPQALDTDTASERLDQRLGSRDQVIVRHAYTQQVVRAFQFVAGQNPDTTTRSTAARATWVRAWSPTTIMDTSMGFDRLRSLLTSEPHAVGPTVSFGSVLTGLGPGSDLPIDRVQNQFRFAWQVRTAWRKHTLAAGADVNRRQVNGYESSSNRGVTYFTNDLGRDAITNFRMGIPSRMTIGIGDSRRGFRYWEPQWFVGDTWKAASRLTLSLSLRYRPTIGPAEVNGLTDIPYRCDCNNVAPQFGIAYQLPSRWGVVRSAYGMHFSEIYPVTFQQLRFTAPQFLKIEVQAPNNILNLLEDIDVGPGVRTTKFEMNRNLVAPYSHLYNFNWEPRVSGHVAVQLGYVGSRSHQLLMLWTMNRAGQVEGIANTTRTIEQRRANPSYYEIRRVVNASNAYFDAARASVALRDVHGLTLDAAYWFSKAIDLGANYTNTAASDDGRQGKSQTEAGVLRDLKGLSAFDQPHAFLVRASYLTPLAPSRMAGVFGRVNLSLVMLAKSGTPFDVLTGSDGPGYGNVDGTSGDRPNLLDPSVLGRTIGNPDTATTLMPRSAFAYIRAGEVRGNLGRSAFRKGGIRNVNAAVSRTWTMRHERAFTLRAESINLLNTPQFGQPGNELTSSNFGQITNTLNDGRAFEVNLLFRF